ncbi:hypothetical protein [Embleya sp. NBC_00896]|uniref:hypothetical protein n=1 Tax=Embleya sp. NBC_00896 TaxID=2975961 RepID=UPI00386CC912|nr:hypothetical protein OG928_06735 [Embleya sp. NBC_00896]
MHVAFDISIADAGLSAPRGCLTVPGPRPHPDTSMRWVVPPGLDTNLTCLTALAVAFRHARSAPCAD